MTGRAQPDEFELIERLFAPLSAGAPLAFGLTDDAALIRPRAGTDLVATTDSLVAGVHFLAADPPDLVARKLLRVNLSDLAAMGATPLGHLVNLALPRGAETAWVEEFAAGLAVDQERFGTALIGGDTVATEGPLVLGLTALGEVARGRALRRNGARPGDLVMVSGTLGDAALGLRVLRGDRGSLDEGAAAYLVGRYRLPEPRVALGRRLVGLATAAIDVSDGLVADVGHVCAASGVGATLEAAKLPLSAAATARLGESATLVEAVLAGGDDYELALTVSPERAGEAMAAARDLDLPLTIVGRVREGEGVAVIGADGERMHLDTGGYRHF